MIKLHKLLVTGVSLVLLLLLVSCEKNSDPDLNTVGWTYYPLQQGQYRLYDVYRIEYKFGEENDTLVYELKERVANYFLNQEGDTVFTLQRLQRANAQESWKLDSAYLIQRSPRWLMQSVNNRPQLQLVFPVAEGRTWNSNLLNAAPADSFKMMEVGKPFTLGDVAWENTLRVEQEEMLDTIVETDQREEVFAAGTGMIYKRIRNYKYCSTQDCVGQGIISTGQFLEMSLKESGIEE